MISTTPGEPVYTIVLEDRITPGTRTYGYQILFKVTTKLILGMLWTAGFLGWKQLPKYTKFIYSGSHYYLIPCILFCKSLTLISLRLHPWEKFPLLTCRSGKCSKSDGDTQSPLMASFVR